MLEGKLAEQGRLFWGDDAPTREPARGCTAARSDGVDRGPASTSAGASSATAKNAADEAGKDTERPSAT
eukprot:5422875-Alexandrium_andersonii.AAC.1